MVIQGYNRFGGISPESAPLANVLHAMGASYSEPFVFGMCGGIGASYFVFEYKGMPPNVFLGMRHGLYGSADFFANGCKRLGATPVFKETSSAGAAQKHLLATLEAGIPAVAYVSGAQAYSYHHVGVAGLDGETVLLDDMEPAPVAMSLEQFAQRRAAIGQFKNRLLSVTVAAGRPDLRAGILAAIAATVKGMQEAHIPSFASNFGLKSLQKFARLLADAKDKKGWAKQFPPGPKLENGLKWVHRYTKNGAFRGMYADFLEESARIAGCQPLAGCAENYRALEARWKAFAAMAAEGLVSGGLVAGAELAPAMSALHAAESAALQALQDALPAG